MVGMVRLTYKPQRLTVPPIVLICHRVFP